VHSQENIQAIVEEYRSLFAGAKTDEGESLENMLVCKGDWSQKAASDLLQLAHNYGSFMLRNALAISMALGIEDGDFGF